MSKTVRVKFVKYGDMIYISHLDVQRLLQRAFRRAGIELSYSQGFNPHPKMSYGNALSLGVESHGEYVDIEIEEDIDGKELMERVNGQLPEGMEFVDCCELEGGERALAANIEFGDYEFMIDKADIENADEEKLSEEYIKSRIKELLSMDEIMIVKKNKKGRMVENNIRPLIKTLSLEPSDDGHILIKSLIATGSKQNLNTNVYLPKLLEILDYKMDPLDIDIKRNDLYFSIDGKLTAPIEWCRECRNI